MHAGGRVRTEPIRRAAPARPGLPEPPGFRATPGPEALVQLELWGALSPDWCRRLASGLAARGVSLLSGVARRSGHPGSPNWRARLRVELLSPEQAELDFLALTEAKSSLPLRFEPPLLHVATAPGPRAGSLEVEVHAWESVGLLATVLGDVRDVGLVAGELELETEDDCAFHRLVLEAPSGRVTRGQVRTLARALRARI